MQLEERRMGPVIVLDATGKLALGEGDVLLRDKVHSLVEQGHTHVILNLGGVPSMDSAGLGEIVGCYSTLSRVGGTLKLLNLTTRIHDLLTITKLLTVFESFTSEEEAVRSFTAAV